MFKKLLFIVLWGGVILTPVSVQAQRNDGFFRDSSFDNYDNRDVVWTTVITTQNLGEPAPLESGLLVLTAAGASYVLLRRKEEAK